MKLGLVLSALAWDIIARLTHIRAFMLLVLICLVCFLVIALAEITVMAAVEAGDRRRRKAAKYE